MRSTATYQSSSESVIDDQLPSHTVAVLVAVAMVGAVLHAIRFDFKIDDAYIAFTYARNWVAGQGIVFNVGERVEGYTCFSWVALSALGMALGADIARWSQVWCWLASAGTVCATWCLTRALLPRGHRSVAALAALAIAVYPPLAWAAGSRMETALYTCLLTATLALHVRRGAQSWAAPLCLVLTALTRPEGWLLAVLLCADALRSGPRRAALRYVALVLALLGPYFVWRYSYYGYPLPNTFYAKVSASTDQLARGLHYLGLFMKEPTTWWIVGLAVLAGWRGRKAVVAVFLLAYFGYVVSVGGDVFRFHRFFVPLVPTLIAAASVGLLRVVERLIQPAWQPRLAALAAAYALFAVACVPMHREQHQDLDMARVFSQLLEVPCPYVLQNTAPTDSIAAVGIGRLKFCTDRRVIDLVGLTDAHIAHRAVPEMGRGHAGHERYDADYVLAQRPAYIIIPLRGYMLPSFDVPAIRMLWEHPDLDRFYVGESSGLVMWYRRRDVPRLMPPQ